MRTTLDLDEVVLSAARAKARAERISLGRAVSDLALSALAPQRGALGGKTGFPVLRGTPGHTVTDELVERYRDDN